MDDPLQIDEAITNAATAVVDHLRSNVYRRATQFLSPTLTVKGTRRHRKPGRQMEILLVIGKPNYAERAMIKKAKGSDVPLYTETFLEPWRKKR